MTDAFNLLRLPRRPWLEADEVRSAFQRLAAETHPDVSGGNGDFAGLTQAYETLRDPASRLRHWLALCAPEIPIPPGVPPELFDWFPRVGAQLKTLKEAAQARNAATSALGKAMAVTGAREGEALLSEVKALRNEALSRVQQVAEGDPAAIGAKELATIAGRLGFLDKWIAQLAEALLALRL